MRDRSAIVPFSIAVAVGVALWLAVSLLAGQREAWDTSAYWAFAYPAAILTCALLGYAYPNRPWPWVVTVFAPQFLAMCLRNGELGNLWPLGATLFAVMALPAVVAANLASRLSAHSGQGAA